MSRHSRCFIKTGIFAVTSACQAEGRRERGEGEWEREMVWGEGGERGEEGRRRGRMGDREKGHLIITYDKTSAVLQLLIIKSVLFFNPFTTIYVLESFTH